MAGRVPSLRNIPVTRGLYGRLPDVYPIFTPLILRGAEALCAEDPLFQHTLEERQASMRLRTITILGTEPRASSSRTRRTHRAADVAPAGMVAVWYTQGGVPGMVGREMYTHQDTRAT